MINVENKEVGVVIELDYEGELFYDDIKEMIKLGQEYPHLIIVDDFTWVMSNNEEDIEFFKQENALYTLNPEEYNYKGYNSERYKNYKFYVLIYKHKL